VTKISCDSSHLEMLFLLSTLGMGGSESKTVRIVNALVETGMDARIAYLNPPNTLVGRVSPAVNLIHLDRRGKYSLRALRRLCGAVRGRKVAIFAVNLYPLLYALPAVNLAAGAGSRIIGMVNTAELTGRARHLGLVYAPFLRRCNQVVFGCRAQMSHWSARYGIDSKRCTHIYNGVDETFFSPQRAADPSPLARPSISIPDNAIVFGSVGRLAPEKSLDLLVHAVGTIVSQGRNAYLVIVGDGDQRAPLQRLADAAGISERVRILGSQCDVRPALAMMDVFVLPSSSVETFSNAALEAMAFELPVILSNIGGAAEMLEPGKSGLLFEVGDGPGLIKQMVRLCDSANLRRSLGKQARARVTEHFQFKDMLAKYVALAET
jgi:glycosyltransferase involved in cell wall biosynthesis